MGYLLALALVAADTTGHPGIRQLHGIHSRLRSNRGLAAQTLCPRLCSRAQGWADTMAKQGSFRHSGMGVRENIAMGHRSCGSVMRGWMDSEGHRRNLMSGGSRVGFGYQRAGNGQVYWVSLHSSGGSNVAAPHRTYKPKPSKRRRRFRLFR